ncbi:3-hydroxyacyl-ACP dehydratase FabZ [Enterobacteriaceae endosymbiont of Neohaemonia nigricornis]|uniref:3-hydroxyacyl-ACP dehydratase FabZ n=1 Tax=Enterobacteriaceae endosymbiont of Neohaemonia nigricornis TaxID=2675792 RepID=UPI00144A17A1|nr:3-hydroxyacyl-ACP dehydratase FabZ [Enterobacteriaceae endosymbiont of Neohaemonia nigricornis]QJC30417.1 3-hydroxyacyl-ACP dehydratase FabZ [Enterobacteriaceae endosymbiont of Neohaemonia nigricornis]
MEIQKILPHKYPFILIDRIIICESNFIYSLKNISFNEPCFQGHFPNQPIYPGVLILESMIQNTSFLLYKNSQILKKTVIYYIAGIDHARFKKIVLPGDQMFLESYIYKTKKHLIFCNILAKVNNQVVCKAKIICAQIIQ